MAAEDEYEERLVNVLNDIANYPRKDLARKMLWRALIKIAEVLGLQLIFPENPQK